MSVSPDFVAVRFASGIGTRMHIALLVADARVACLCCADDPKEAIAENLFNRSEEFKARRAKQIQTPDFPTTTIGSFPQTPGNHLCHCSPLDSCQLCFMGTPAVFGCGGLSGRWPLCSACICEQSASGHQEQWVFLPACMC